MSTANPRRRAASLIANRARWGEQRRLRLDELDADTRRLVLALVEQARAKAEAAEADAA